MAAAEAIGSQLSLEHPPFEEASERRVSAGKTPVVPYPFWNSVRFLVITLLGFLGTVNLYILRVNLSIALPCMVFINVTKSASVSIQNSSVNATITNIETGARCVRPPPENTSDSSRMSFVWGEETRGIVNGMFFIGYLFLQVPSALLAHYYGPKRVMLAFISVATLASLAQHPLAALFGRNAAHWSFFILRFLNGVGSAGFFPVYTSLLANWSPPLERSRMIGTACAGMYFGIVVMFAAGGFMCKSLGWPSLFYIPGFVSIGWLVLWGLLVADSPEKHRWIRPAERDYILASLGRSVQQSAAEQKPAPAAEAIPLTARLRSKLPLLRKVFTSPCVLALCAAHVAYDYGCYAFLTNVPSFMDEVLYFKIEANGLVSSVPYILYWAVTTAVGYGVDHMLDRKLLPLLFIRKAVTGIGLIGSAVVVCLLAFTDCTQPVWAVVILSLAVALEGFCVSGFLVNYIDVAPRYSGALVALCNTFASIPGFVAPFLVATITKNHTHAEWNIAFFICAGVMAAGALVYLVLARADVQSWAREDTPSAPANGTDKADEANERLTSAKV